MEAKFGTFHSKLAVIFFWVYGEGVGKSPRSYNTLGRNIRVYKMDLHRKSITQDGRENVFN
jgi:hypothetical protein